MKKVKKSGSALWEFSWEATQANSVKRWKRGVSVQVLTVLSPAQCPPWLLVLTGESLSSIADCIRPLQQVHLLSFLPFYFVLHPYWIHLLYPSYAVFCLRSCLSAQTPPLLECAPPPPASALIHLIKSYFFFEIHLQNCLLQKVDSALPSLIFPQFPVLPFGNNTALPSPERDTDQGLFIFITLVPSIIPVLRGA